MLKKAVEKRPFVMSLAFGLAHAALFWLAFPPVSFWPATLVCVAPLIMLARWTARPGRSFLAVWLAALPASLAQHWWMRGVTVAGLPALAAYLALYPALFVWAMSRWRLVVGAGAAFWLAAPIAWTGLEALRASVVWDGYPWYLIGHPMIDAPGGWIALGRLGGAQGVSLAAALIATAAAGAACARTAQGRIGLGAAAVLLAAALLAPLYPVDLGERSAGEVRIALIQTNVPQSNRTAWTVDQRRADFSRMVALTREAAADAPDVIVWPETMFPGLSLNAEAVEVERAEGLNYAGGAPTTIFVDGLLALQRSIGIPLVIGATARDGLRFTLDDEGRTDIESDASYNSAFVLAGGRVLDARYDKVHLTPFGEVMPLISRWDSLERALLAVGATGMAFDLSAGAEARALDVPLGAGERPLRIGTPICFEATMPEVCRRLVEGDGGAPADALVNLTNDGWFGGSSAGRESHLLCARWRCVELGVPMLRAANTGISCQIDPAGRVLAPAGVNREGIVFGEVSVRPTGDGPRTVFARTGDVAGPACMLLFAPVAAGAVGAGVVERRRARRSGVGGGVESPKERGPGGR